MLNKNLLQLPLKKDQFNYYIYVSDVGQNLQFDFCNYLILIFLCKKHYFRFR